MQSLAVRSGLVPLPSRLARPGRALVAPVLAAKGKSAPPAEAPTAAAPAPAPAPPSDIPAYFQPAPVPQQYEQRQAQQYQAVPMYGPPPTPAKESFWSSINPLVYIGVGVVLATVLSKVMGIVKGGPAKVQEMMMQQMMKQMMQQMGAPPGGAGASPFGGANPFGAGAANPFGAAAGGANPFGSAPGSGFPSSFPPMQPAFDTTATPAASSAAAGASTKASSSTAASSGAAPASAESKPKRKSAFTDVNASSSTSGPTSSSNGSGEAAAGSSSGAAPPPPFNMPPPPFNMPNMPPPPFNMPNMPPPPAGGAGAGAGDGKGAGGVAGTMLDMLKNPEMQKMLYPYLPEPMRNQETFEWMLSNPEYRQQLEGMLQQQAAASGSPAMAEMMAGMDMTPEKMQSQFDALGMTPDQFISKVMADPDLAKMMTDPKIMAAIAECTKNPMAIFNYQSDAEVMRVFEKMSVLFPQAAGAGALPNMPPGFGQPPFGQPPQ